MKRIVALLIACPQLAWAAVPTGTAETPESPTLSDASPEADAQPSTPDTGTPAGPDAAQTAAAPGIGYLAEVDVASRCLWRGLAFSENPVLQPFGSVSAYGATLGIAGLDFLGTEPGVEHNFAELDLLASYELTLGAATLSPSLSVYTYPDASNTAELGATLSYDLHFLSLQTRHSLDIAENAGGWYADFGASRSQPLIPSLTLEALASVAWFSGSYSRYYIEDSMTGMHVGAAMLDSSLVLEASDSIYFRLHGTVSRMLEQHIRNLAPQENLFAGGLAMGIAR